MRIKLVEIHPGEILLEEFMKPLALTIKQLAADIDVTPWQIIEIINNRNPITANLAIKLGLFFSVEPKFWINLQAEYNFRQALEI